jgi:general secretion pathway protein D
MAIDEPSNTIIALSTPAILDQVATLIERIDHRKPQVELEIIMVVLADNDKANLGIEMASTFKENGTTVNLASLFGLGTDSVGDEGDAANPGGELSNLTGFTGLVLNPGDFAVLVNALETVDNGRAVVRAKMVVDNNAEATTDSVTQEPIANVNSNTNIATTSFGGTSDAGTQINIKPTIHAGDHVTLNFAITQSDFVGESTVTADGGVIPPTRRNDSVSAVATVPDGFVIALGGVSTRGESDGESHIPILGSIPFLGALFRNRSRTDQGSRFFVFIKADIMRHPEFADLKFSSELVMHEAELANDPWPVVRTRFIGESPMEHGRRIEIEREAAEHRPGLLP